MYIQIVGTYAKVPVTMDTCHWNFFVLNHIAIDNSASVGNEEEVTIDLLWRVIR